MFPNVFGADTARSHPATGVAIRRGHCFAGVLFRFDRSDDSVLLPETVVLNVFSRWKIHTFPGTPPRVVASNVQIGSIRQERTIRFLPLPVRIEKETR